MGTHARFCKCHFLSVFALFRFPVTYSVDNSRMVSESLPTRRQIYLTLSLPETRLALLGNVHMR